MCSALLLWNKIQANTDLLNTGKSLASKQFFLRHLSSENYEGCVSKPAFHFRGWTSGRRTLRFNGEHCNQFSWHVLWRFSSPSMFDSSSRGKMGKAGNTIFCVNSAHIYCSLVGHLQTQTNNVLFLHPKSERSTLVPQTAVQHTLFCKKRNLIWWNILRQ